MQIGAIIDFSSADAFAQWLDEHGRSAKEVWAAIYKKASGKQTVSFDELLEIALCYGWIDGFTKSLDDERYVIRFTPRKKKSAWSAYNRALVQRLLDAGRMTPAGTAVLPDDLTLAFPAETV